MYQSQEIRFNFPIEVIAHGNLWLFLKTKVKEKSSILMDNEDMHMLLLAHLSYLVNFNYTKAAILGILPIIQGK